MIYLDTSAAMKLVRVEQHSHALSAWLAGRVGPIVSSVLIEIELQRAVRRLDPSLLPRAAEVLRGIGVLTLSPPVVARAAAYSEPGLRSLDAIHLASAEELQVSARTQLHALIAYDDRLLEAANLVGLPALAPGR